MDFTREPIIETVITPKEGCKLVVRSSKSTGQEEYFVDAVEVVSFGHSFFFRSLERPKSFFVPATDYEILEVREARMVLKNVGVDRTIKIAGGREAQMRPSREHPEPKVEAISCEEITSSKEASNQQPSTDKAQEARLDKKRDRRRHQRRRRGREGVGSSEEGQEYTDKEGAASRDSSLDQRLEGESQPLTQQVVTTSILTSLLPPPLKLISETIASYKDNILFKDAFYTKDEPISTVSVQEQPSLPLEQAGYLTLDVSEEEEEKIYQQRKLADGFEDVVAEEDSSNGFQDEPFNEHKHSSDTPS